MSMPVPPNDPQATEAKPHPVDTFAEELQLFWLKNRNLITGCCIVVLLIVVGKGAYSVYVEQREKHIASEYASAGSVSEKLKQFAVNNEGHSLAGIAYLRLADEAFAAGKYAEAADFYAKAVPAVKGTAFASRAALGAAISQVFLGKSAEGKAALAVLANNPAEFKGIRAEAGYHLANLAVEAGKPEDAAKFIDQVIQVDSTGMWAQRALLLRASLPISASAPSALAQPSTGASSEVKLSVPGK
jgi:tetratricopeptide (TPR) repeat protein